MVAKSRNMISILVVFIFAAVFISSSAPVRVEASDIDVYTNSEDNTTEGQKSVAFETTVINSDNTTTASVDMIETYDEAYGLYEESISNEFFIYANVGNGGISNSPVKIDIPANVNFTLEKGGRKVNYTSGTEIKGKGNFVLRVTAVSGTTTYQSTFRFSIRDAAEKKAEETLTDSTTTGADNNTSETENDTGITETDLEEPETEVTQDSQSSEVSNMDESNTEEASQGEEDGATFAVDSLSGVAKYTKFSETFDEVNGEYVNTLGSGDVFRTNLPNGIITNSEVVLNIPDSLDYTIYKDDVLYETTSLQFEEAGSYRVVISSDSLDYVLAYGSEMKLTYSFRIIVEAVSDIHIFNVPAGFALTEVYYGENEVFAVNGMQGSYFKLTEDGSYLFKYADSETGASYSTNVVLDTQAPELVIGIKNGVANITYNSTDIDTIELMKDNVAQTGFSTYKITGKGDYTLTVTDHANNKATANFQLKDSVNSATIWSLIILAAIISGVFSIFRINKKKVIVR